MMSYRPLCVAFQVHKSLKNVILNQIRIDKTRTLSFLSPDTKWAFENSKTDACCGHSIEYFCSVFVDTSQANLLKP